MRNSTTLALGCLAAVLAGMPGCAQIPADHDTLPQQDLARAQLAADIKLARDGWPEPQWWRSYGDGQLNRLIAEALKDGPTLQAAAARIGSARAALDLDSADRGVNAVLNATTTRQRYSANGLLPAPIGGSYYTDSKLQASANYDFDWWGRHRSLIAAAVGEVNARRAEYAQSEQTLAAAVAQSYFNLQGAWTRLANLREIRAAQSELVADKVKRIANGLASIDEQRAAEADLTVLNRQYAALDAQIGREREALRALLGADSKALADLAPHPIPDTAHALPSALGIELLARRPDLQAARWRVEASLGRVEATQAAFYPDINLTGLFGFDALTLDKLLTAASRTPFIGPTLSLPLFDSGRLQARLGAARAERNELIADYNQSVFKAVRDVAQEAVALQGLEKQIREQAAATEATDALLRSAQARFRQGLADRSMVLAARLAVLKQQDATLDLKNQELLTEVALIKALGGGYRTEQAPAGTALSQK